MNRRKWLRRLLADESGMVTVEAAYAIAAIVGADTNAQEAVVHG